MARVFSFTIIWFSIFQDFSYARDRFARCKELQLNVQLLQSDTLKLAPVFFVYKAKLTRMPGLGVFVDFGNISFRWKYIYGDGMVGSQVDLGKLLLSSMYLMGKLERESAETLLGRAGSKEFVLSLNPEINHASFTGTELINIDHYGELLYDTVQVDFYFESCSNLTPYPVGIQKYLREDQSSV